MAVSELIEIRTTDSAAPFRGARYSQAVRCGEFVFASGQIALDPKTGLLTGDTLAEQMSQVFQNIGNILKAAGSNMDRVVKIVVYLADIADYDELNRLYGQYVGDLPPARTTVQALLPAQARIEVDVTAVV
jgi:2-iminobutanoate/2-iminopropanoate deaminase